MQRERSTAFQDNPHRPTTDQPALDQVSTEFVGGGGGGEVTEGIWALFHKPCLYIGLLKDVFP